MYSFVQYFDVSRYVFIIMVLFKVLYLISCIFMDKDMYTEQLVSVLKGNCIFYIIMEVLYVCSD